MSLINELKRRNVFKVGAAYLALGWVVVQATATLAPAFRLPESALPLVTWIGVIGFPFVLLFSWAYELTPEGLKRESEVDRSQSITHVTSKRLDYIIIAMLAVAIGLFVLQYLRPPAAEVAPTAAIEVVATPTTSPAVQAEPPAAPQPAAAIAPDEKSIAVLPFADMSQAKDQEYFSDGISEELLNLLAKIPELKVIARTSSFAFKGEKMEIAEIARRLNVAHVLEGSVRKSGNTVRITVQLVRTADSTHLWSETYDRPLDDIFKVQDEIAGAVVEQLKLKILGAVPKVREVDPEAYTLYLRAVQVKRLYTREGMEQAFALYQQALAIDPAYPAAWSGVAGYYFGQAFWGRGPRSPDENFRLAREAASKALAIDPEYAPAHANLGEIARNYDNDLAAAAQHIERALALDSSNPDVIGQVVGMLTTLGRLERAIEFAKHMATRDPVFYLGHFAEGRTYARMGRLEEAVAKYRTALMLNPDAISLHFYLAVALLLKGDKEVALATIQAEPDEAWRMTGLALLNHALGRKAESDAALAELIEKHEMSWSDVTAWVLAYRGETDAAFEWMEKAVANHNGGVNTFLVEPLMSSLHQDPRWLPFLRKIGRAPDQLAAIKFDVKLPQR